MSRSGGAALEMSDERTDGGAVPRGPASLDARRRVWARLIWTGLLSPVVVALMLAALFAASVLIEGRAAAPGGMPADPPGARDALGFAAALGVPIALVVGGPVGGAVAAIVLRRGPPSLGRAALTGAITGLVCAAAGAALTARVAMDGSGVAWALGSAIGAVVLAAVGALATFSVWALLRPRRRRRAPPLGARALGARDRTSRSGGGPSAS